MISLADINKSELDQSVERIIKRSDAHVASSIGFSIVWFPSRAIATPAHKLCVCVLDVFLLLWQLLDIWSQRT